MQLHIISIGLGRYVFQISLNFSFGYTFSLIFGVTEFRFTRASLIAWVAGIRKGGEGETNARSGEGERMGAFPPLLSLPHSSRASRTRPPLSLSPSPSSACHTGYSLRWLSTDFSSPYLTFAIHETQKDGPTRCILDRSTYRFKIYSVCMGIRWQITFFKNEL